MTNRPPRSPWDAITGARVGYALFIVACAIVVLWPEAGRFIASAGAFAISALYGLGLFLAAVPLSIVFFSPLGRRGIAPIDIAIWAACLFLLALMEYPQDFARGILGALR